MAHDDEQPSSVGSGTRGLSVGSRTRSLSVGSGPRGPLDLWSGRRGLSGPPSSIESGTRGLSRSSVGSGSRGLSGSPLDRTYELVEESRPDEEPVRSSLHLPGLDQPLWTGRLFEIANIRGNRTVIRKAPTADQIAGLRTQPFEMRDFWGGSKRLGSGGFGQVFVGVVHSDLLAMREMGVDVKPYFALKLVDAKRANLEYIYAERDCLVDLQMSPFFPRLFASFLYPGGGRAVYVMERIFGQTLGDHLLEQFLNEMDDVWVRFFLSQIMSAVSFMHCAGIVHRDLKSDNIMVRYPDRKIVIIDFGLAKRMNSYEVLHGLEPCKSPVGTDGYKAPEMMLGDRYGSAVDMWAVGCLAYEMKKGRCKTPFEQHDPSKSGVHRHGLSMVERFVKDAQLRDFVLRCLEYDPSKRLWATEALRHRFLGGDITAPTPPRALRDDRVSMPIDFSRFYYVAPELERYDGTEPFFSKLNYDHDYETVPMESVSMAAMTAAIEERKNMEDNMTLSAMMMAERQMRDMYLAGHQLDLNRPLGPPPGFQPLTQEEQQYDIATTSNIIDMPSKNRITILPFVTSRDPTVGL